MLVDDELATEILRVYESWTVRWRKYNREQEERMKPTVTFYPELAHTPENEDRAREIYENQSGLSACPDDFLNDGRVWGFVGPTASLLFQVPQT